MSGLAERLAAVRASIERARLAAGRTDEVLLVAVTKTVGPDAVREAYQAGQRVFGENRVQEGREKIAALSGEMADACWHLIGHLQTNKARQAAGSFALIESVDSIRLAARLDQVAGPSSVPVLLEVNVAGEESKSGFQSEELRGAMAELRSMEHLELRGLMTVAPLVADPEEVRPVFRRLRELRDELRDEFDLRGFDQLSMGMTNDFPVAVEEGATMVRVGRALFGERRT
jgi:pyridoxal phosphate enzyme (YggS family)